MRVGHFITELVLAHGGVVRAVLDLAGVLAERGIGVAIVSHHAPDWPAEWSAGAADPHSPTLTTIPWPVIGKLRFSRSQFREARRLVSAFDAVHLHAVWEPSIAEMARACRAEGVPYCVSTHGMLDDWCMAQRTAKKRLFLAMFGSAMLRGADAVLTTAAGEREQAQRWAPGARFEVIPLAFDPSPFDPLPGPESARAAVPETDTDEPIVLFLSRVHPKKGIERLIDTAAEMERRGVAARFIVAGPGDESYLLALRHRAAASGVGHRVRFVGPVFGDAKASLYQLASVFCLPTHQENWGFVLIESLVCGTPVVTTRGVDIWPELEASGGAIIADPTPVSLADAIAVLLGDPPHARRMGAHGREWCVRNLSPDIVGGRYEEFYRRLSRRSPTTASQGASH